MKECIKKEGKRDHSQYDAFFLCVMTHGAGNVVYGTDGEKVYIEKDIVQPFYQGRCTTLDRKPKVFLIQACRIAEKSKLRCWVVALLGLLYPAALGRGPTVFSKIDVYMSILW